MEGTIIARHIAVGQRVDPQAEAQSLFTIASDLTKMRTVANVPEREAGEIKPGDKASFTVDGFPGRSFEATVGEVHPTQTTHNTASYAVVLDLDTSQIKVVLPPGQAVTAEIVAAERKDVLRIPDKALDFVPRNIAPPPVLPVDQGRVWVLQDGKPSPKVVKLGLDDGRYTEILEGELEPSDRVVVGRN